MPYYLCVNGSINKDGSDLLDIRVDVEECVDYFEQCCATGDTLDKPILHVIDGGQGGNQGGQIGNQGQGGIGGQGGQGGQLSNQGQGGIGGQGTQGGQGGPVIEVPAVASQCGFRNAEGVGFRITGNSDGESEYGWFDLNFNLS